MGDNYIRGQLLVTVADNYDFKVVIQAICYTMGLTVLDRYPRIKVALLKVPYGREKEYSAKLKKIDGVEEVELDTYIEGLTSDDLEIIINEDGVVGN